MVAPVWTNWLPVWFWYCFKSLSGSMPNLHHLLHTSENVRWKRPPALERQTKESQEAVPWPEINRTMRLQRTKFLVPVKVCVITQSHTDKGLRTFRSEHNNRQSQHMSWQQTPTKMCSHITNTNNNRWHTIPTQSTWTQTWLRWRLSWIRNSISSSHTPPRWRSARTTFSE